MNKIDFVLLFDVTDANPNGDPDAGNMPRSDAETNHGMITDVCLKRKIRNYVQMVYGEKNGYDIYVKEKAVLNKYHEDAYNKLGISLDKDKKEKKEKKDKDVEVAKEWMCKTFFDIRTFGAVMSLKEANCGQVRGPVQLSFSRSIDPINPKEFTVTRCAVATEKESEKQEGGNRTMGRKFTVPYALYMTKGTINPCLAKQTGFNEQDLDVFVEALKNMFEFDASAARPAGSMVMREIILFKHNSELGSAPAHCLFESIKVEKKEGIEFPRSYSDYNVTIDQEAFSGKGVEMERIGC